MRIFFFLFIVSLSLFSAAQKQQLSYAFAFDTAASVLKIDMTMNGTDSGKTYIKLFSYYRSRLKAPTSLKRLIPPSGLLPTDPRPGYTLPIPYSRTGQVLYTIPKTSVPS